MSCSACGTEIAGGDRYCQLAAVPADPAAAEMLAGALLDLVPMTNEATTRIIEGQNIDVVLTDSRAVGRGRLGLVTRLAGRSTISGDQSGAIGNGGVDAGGGIRMPTVVAHR